MAIDRSLVSGSMAMMILKLLSEKDMYGYEMIDTLRQRSENVFELKAGTLYPLLHNLEDKHFVVSYEEEVPGKVRKYYRITKEGRKHPVSYTHLEIYGRMKAIFLPYLFHRNVDICALNVSLQLFQQYLNYNSVFDFI